MTYICGRFIFVLGLKRVADRLYDESREWRTVEANPGSHRIHFPEANADSESDISKTELVR